MVLEIVFYFELNNDSFVKFFDTIIILERDASFTRYIHIKNLYNLHLSTIQNKSIVSNRRDLFCFQFFFI